MWVSVCSTGAGSYGLRVRKRDVERFFPPSTGTIDVQVGHEFVTVQLPDSFWTSSPVLSHPRIEAWLRERRLVSWRKGAPPQAKLDVEGPGIYRLTRPGDDTFQGTGAATA